MILGLPVDGQPVCGNLQPAGWRDMVKTLLGSRPPEQEQDAKDKKPCGISSAWLATNLWECAPDAAEEFVETYARAWLWHLIGGYLFLDESSNTAQWDHGNLGGCAYLLQVWDFEDEGSMPTVAFLWKNVKGMEYWHSILPLICFSIVEIHPLNRVMRKFGRLQRTPPDTASTSVTLHKINRRKQRGARDWRDIHNTYLLQWANRS
ncbi:protein MAIN-LIKE 1-like [Phragmites australis]|uniref:protein MAIN-LIKE 1-like n=1 Tax=Phragmites australis TaxID=29695 RepID=UPI002D781B01|nr:protein MAIN-LIKE 1-like [Phragmites australis]